MRDVASFYRFVAVGATQALAAALEALARDVGVVGTVIVAKEGINGTLAGEREALEAIHRYFEYDPRFAGMPFRYSTAKRDNSVFYRLKVRVKDEIVALRQPGIDVAAATGVHVGVAQWHGLLDDPDVVVVDTRNRYEIEVGTFPGAIDPGTRSFREFPDWVARHLDPERNPRVAMFCTGGVRCEKASSYLLQQGFATVYQLDGGVLGYLDAAGADSRWRGECYVFDQRVAVNAELGEGEHVQCQACGQPLASVDVNSPDFVAGMSCPNCVDAIAPARRAGFAERVRQERLASMRGVRHVGAEMRKQGPARW